MNYTLKFVSHSASKQTIIIFKVNINKAYGRRRKSLKNIKKELLQKIPRSIQTKMLTMCVLTSIIGSDRPQFGQAVSRLSLNLTR